MKTSCAGKHLIEQRGEVKDQLMHMFDLERVASENGVSTFVSDFYTEHLLVHAKLTSPERRLSDHLNSSVSTVDVRPISALQNSTEIETDLARFHAHLTKARILFVVPVAEPERPRGQNNAAWKATTKYGAWGGVGPYSFRGSIHTDAGRDPQFALRLLDKQFLPVTDVSVTFPDSETRTFPTLIVNRQHLDILALESNH